MRVAAHFMAATLCAFSASQALAATYDNLFVFGDSTVDSGWWVGSLASPPQCGAVTVPCETGSAGKDALISSAIANGGTGSPVGVGEMNTQILATDFGITNFKPANQGGTNYAISGSLSAPVGSVGNLNQNTKLPSTMTQIANYLLTHGGPLDPNALYLISSGGNDVTYATDNLGTLVAQKAFLVGQASALASEIAILQADGAKSIVVYGLQGGATLPTFMTNTLFSDLKADGVNSLDIDIAGLIKSVQADPSLYGLTTVLPGIVGTGTDSACVTETGAAATSTGWGQWCGNTGPSSSHAYLNPNLTNPEETALFSDDQHLSAAGQQIEADFVFDQITNTPIPATFPLLATSIGCLGLFGWRSKRKARAIAA